MKKMTALLLGSAVLFASNAFAAEIMEKNDFQKVESQYEKLGSISTSGSSPLLTLRKNFLIKLRKKAQTWW